MLKHSAYSFKHFPIAYTIYGSCGGIGRSGMMSEYLLPHIHQGPFYSAELVSFISHNGGMTASGTTVEKNIPHV